MLSAEIRKAFIDYFVSEGHQAVSSSALVMPDDPTLLFVNAGMVQFKDYFLGREKRDYTRAVSVQRCLRAGGKHNDLDNVGYTARHHTLFEMLGNFSFGDYFKVEAITFAWKFLTEVLRLPKEKLWVTVFHDDLDSEKIWLEKIGVDPKRISRCGEKDNFWAMGDTGPCGPCTEIFYDHGPEVTGGPPGSADADGDRYIEVWNLVFMQFDRQSDGQLVPLPAPCVDTGMGLERITAVMQHVHSNYETDIFVRIRGAIAKLAGIPADLRPSLCVIADHIRAVSFLIADGVLPSNEGRGYVLRRIIRRAARHGHQLGLQEPFLHRLVDELAALMGQAYPVIVANKAQVAAALLQEEQQFNLTLEHGLKLFEQAIAKLGSSRCLPGDVIFKLYDTHGFPYDLTADLARERGIELDTEGFEQALQQQRDLSAAHSHFKIDYHQALVLPDNIKTEFLGYQTTQTESIINGVYQNSQSVEKLSKGQAGALILQQSPFYAESGGQVSDPGVIQNNQGGNFIVEHVRQVQGAIVHFGQVSAGEFKQNQPVSAVVTARLRQNTAAHHSATHLLHAALRKILGTHVQQKGSLVDAERLRFDFSHPQALSADQLLVLEDMVNQQIRANLKVETKITTPEQANREGAMALFGERYGDEVRMLVMGDFSKELCGGTHVGYTGEIGVFKVTQESGVAAGVRRIEAVSGESALHWILEQQKILLQCAQQLKTTPMAIGDKLSQLLSKQRDLEQQVQKFQQRLLSGASAATDNSEWIRAGSFKFRFEKFEDLDARFLRERLDQYQQQADAWVAVLGSLQGDRLQLVVGVSRNHTQHLSANDVAKWLAIQIGGQGGGRADMAQAGASGPGVAEHFEAAKQRFSAWFMQHLKQQ